MTPETVEVPDAGLTEQQRQGARRAGIVGSLIFSVGAAIVALGALIIILILGFIGLLGGMASSSESVDANSANALASITVTVGVAALLIAGAAACALVVSHSILRTSGLARPSAVMWRGFGLSAIPTGIFAAVGAIGLLLTTWLTSGMEADADSLWLLAIGAGLLLGLIDLIVTPFVAAISLPKLAQRLSLSPAVAE